MKIGFDNQKYLSMQSEHIRERINQFDNKLYLEFGGKLFDDYHASRVLPGFAPDSKLQMLMQLSDQAEIVVVISAGDIEKNKVRGDLGITYDLDVLRLIEAFRGKGLYVGSVAITQYTGQKSADAFKKKLENLDIPVYIIPLTDIQIMFLILSVTKAMERMITSKPLVLWLLSQLRGLEAERWLPACLSCTMSRNVVFVPVMRSLRHSRSGISR